MIQRSTFGFAQWSGLASSTISCVQRERARCGTGRSRSAAPPGCSPAVSRLVLQVIQDRLPDMLRCQIELRQRARQERGVGALQRDAQGCWRRSPRRWRCWRRTACTSAPCRRWPGAWQAEDRVLDGDRAAVAAISCRRAASIRRVVAVGRVTVSAAQGCGSPSGPMRISRSQTSSVTHDPCAPGMLNGFRLSEGPTEFRMMSFWRRAASG